MKKETSIQWSIFWYVHQNLALLIFSEDNPSTYVLYLILFPTSVILLYQWSLYYLEYSTNQMDSIH